MTSKKTTPKAIIEHGAYKEMKSGAKRPSSPSLIDMTEVLKRTGFSRAYIWKLRKLGKFPQGFKPAGPTGHNYFNEDEVACFLAGEWK